MQLHAYNESDSFGELYLHQKILAGINKGTADNLQTMLKKWTIVKSDKS